MTTFILIVFTLIFSVVKCSILEAKPVGNYHCLSFRRKSLGFIGSHDLQKNSDIFIWFRLWESCWTSHIRSQFRLPMFSCNGRAFFFLSDWFSNVDRPLWWKGNWPWFKDSLMAKVEMRFGKLMVPNWRYVNGLIWWKNTLRALKVSRDIELLFVLK